MNCKNCNNVMIEDEYFKSGVVTMLFGPVADVKEESRFHCGRCGLVEYKQRDGGQDGTTENKT